MIHRALQIFTSPAFNFDEDERIVVPTNNVDLAAPARLKIPVQDRVAVLAQKPGGQLFSALGEGVVRPRRTLRAREAAA